MLRNVEENQVTPFYITTPDGKRLYSWLIAPMRLFADNEREFLVDSGVRDPDVILSAGFKLLTSNPESQLLIYCKLPVPTNDSCNAYSHSPRCMLCRS